MARGDLSLTKRLLLVPTLIFPPGNDIRLNFMDLITLRNFPQAFLPLSFTSCLAELCSTSRVFKELSRTQSSLTQATFRLPLIVTEKKPVEEKGTNSADLSGPSTQCPTMPLTLIVSHRHFNWEKEYSQYYEYSVCRYSKLFTQTWQNAELVPYKICPTTKRNRNTK